LKSKHSRLYTDIARQRIIRIYKLAVERARQGDVEYARRLGLYAWNLYKSTRVRIPRYIKRGICRRCGTPLIPGLTARVRLHSQGGMSYVTVTCLYCGWMRRYRYH